MAPVATLLKLRSLYNRQNELKLADAAERSSVVADWLNQAC